MFLLLPLLSVAQDSTVVTKNFRFADGVYRSFDELRANDPAWPIEEVEIRSFTNPQTFLTQVEGISRNVNGHAVPLDSVWGICLDGIPFVRLPQGEVQKRLPAFAPLKVRGKICYFTYPDWRLKLVPITAYNPYTGRPFLRGKVEREEMVVLEKMLHFETGEVADFSMENFLNWIQDDPVLVETVTSLQPEEMEEKLFKCLLIYDDRNLTYLEKPID